MIPRVAPEPPGQDTSWYSRRTWIRSGFPPLTEGLLEEFLFALHFIFAAVIFYIS
jgi:hypothetical protein